MKKLIIIFAAIVAFCSCEEFQPVFTGKYDSYREAKIWTEEEVQASGYEKVTIASLKARYKTKGGPYNVDADEHIYVKGQVVSSDSTGNFYKGIYIQDETGGIELRLGKYNLANEYKIYKQPGKAGNQWVYVKLNDLTVGAYNGAFQIGYEDESKIYETAYIEVQHIIDTHVLRGELGPRVEPRTITAEDLGDQYSPCLGTLVKIEGLTYANSIFCLVYLNPNLPSSQRDKNHASQRVFLKDKTRGVTTWAMSEEKFKEYLLSGVWDSLTSGYEPGAEFSNKKVSWLRTEGDKPESERKSKYGYFVPSAYTVSQNFKLGKKVCPIRTSGYATFCDNEIPQEILGGAPVTVIGVISYYNSSGEAADAEYQITVSELKDIKY